jgi:hypothetical protein
MSGANSIRGFVVDDRPVSVAVDEGAHPHALDPPVALDPTLLERLERENRQLEFGFETAARALTAAATAAAATAFSKCGEDVERVNRIEALDLFPPLLHRSATDVVAERRVQWAREALDLACASLHRQLDALARIDSGGRSHGADVAAARLALRYYLSVKREQIYPLYQDLLAAA